MKKNKLYTANRWNQPAISGNLFASGGLVQMGGIKPIQFSPQTPELSSDINIKNFNYDPYENYANSTNFLGIKKKDNPFSKMNLKKAFSKENIKDVAGGVGQGLLATGASMAGNALSGAISGGLASKTGEAVGKIGSTVLGMAGTAIGGPIGGAIGSVVGDTLGGITNALIGEKVDTAKLNRVNEDIAKLNSFQSNASSFDGITGPEAVNMDTDVYEGGLFNDVSDKNDELKRKLMAAQSYATRSVDNNIFNLVNSQTNDALANYNAFGGPIETGDMGAIDYGFMTDYLTQKKRENDMKSKMNGIVPMPAFMPNSYAIGGDLQTNGADWSDGLVTIGAGGSHEENKYDGVQLGVDNEGIPNLVEEGETVYNDYVFSNRILADEATKQMFKLPKKKEITFADLSKKLEKEIAETPNDPISKAGFEKQMQMLEEQQERQKQEMEAERAKAAFNALSPEEQTALMQQRAEQEAMAQQQAIAEQQAAMQQPTPEEIDMVQQQIQQMQQADGSEAVLGQEPQMAANGGKLYKGGGDTKKNAGTWKKGTSKENWDKYSRNGLRDFLMKVNDDLVNADTEEEKNKIRENAIKTVRGIQQAYSEAYQNNLTPSEVSEKVTALQKAFQDAGGNAYFGDIDDNINLPKGHNTTDTEKKGWVDGLWGPRTSIRNWGSTEYGDDYDDIKELAASAGLTYAPGQYKYGDNTLYELGMAQPDVAAIPNTELELDPYSEGWEERRGVSTTPVIATTPAQSKKKGIVPDLKKETYFGLFGPAVGLGLMGLGVGKPDIASYDAAASGAGNYTTANWKPLGNYLTYRPLDIWYEQNALNAQSRATDRAILNNSSPSRMAGLLANGYNSQLASGNLFRQAQEYNDNLRKQVADFNRGTDQFNSEQYGATSRFNASAYNDANRASAQMKLHAAQAKDDANRWWTSNLYGNINGLFDNINQWEKWKRDHNSVARMAANGVFGVGTEDTPVFGGYVKESKKSKGGKLKKKGLTI